MSGQFAVHPLNSSAAVNARPSDGRVWRMSKYSAVTASVRMRRTSLLAEQRTGQPATEGKQVPTLADVDASELPSPFVQVAKQIAMNRLQVRPIEAAF